MEFIASKEHEWLKKFLGDWTSRGEAPAGPDQPAITWTATESGQLIGEIWLQVNGKHTMPDGRPAHMQLTLGYDTKKQKFVGSWLGSMMDYFWVYEGDLSADGKALTLSATGPRMDQPDKMARYQDIHTFVSNSHRILTSQYEDENGEWQQFMQAHYHRAASAE
jgi:hypothetical protein